MTHQADLLERAAPAPVVHEVDATPSPAPRRPLHGMSSGALATIGLIAVTAVWGSTFILIKDTVTRLPVADFLVVRFAVATLALLVVRPTAIARLSPRLRRQGALLGVVYGLAQVLQTTGLAHTSASVSGFITGMYVVFTPIIAALLLRTRIGATTWIAVTAATAGLAVLSLNGFALGGGELITLASAVLYAAHIVGVGAWTDARSAYGLAVVQMAAVTVVCVIFAAPGGITMPDTGGEWGAVLYTGLIAGALAMVVQTWAQAHLPATRAAVIMTMEPVFAAGFAVAIGGEALTPRMLVGGALVLGAMYLVELRPRRSPAT